MVHLIRLMSSVEDHYASTLDISLSNFQWVYDDEITSEFKVNLIEAIQSIEDGSIKPALKKKTWRYLASLIEGDL